MTYPNSYSNIGQVNDGGLITSGHENAQSDALNGLVGVLTLNPPKAPVRLATHQALAASTYASGVLTADDDGALSIDGVSAANGDRVLVKNETDASINGIYVVTAAGSVSTGWELTRSADMNLSAQIPGAVVFVSEGEANARRFFGVNGDSSFVLDTDDMVWVDVGGSRQSPSVRLATAAALASYSVSGNVLTASANGALSVDGAAVSAEDRILVKNESAGNARYNGVYVVTNGGGASAPFVLTRALDMDGSEDVVGSTIYVQAGSTNAGTLWGVTSTTPFTINTSDVTFAQLGGPPQASVGMNNQRITALHDPSGDQDAATMKYVDDRLATKQALDGDLTALAGLSGTGIAKRTGVDAWSLSSTTADLPDSADKRYVTDAQLTVLGNTSGTNTGDQTLGGLGGVPTSRMVNGHALDADVTVTKGDVGLGNVANVDTTTTANIADSTDKRFVTDAQQTVLGNTSGTNSGNETATSVGTLISVATEKAAPVDADMVGLMDSAATNVLKKLSWSNIKATLKTYFDTLYQAAHATLAALAGISATGLLVRTGAGTAAARTITGTTNRVTVSNGDGVGGNPTITLPQDIHTAATPQFARLGLNGAPTSGDALRVYNSNARDRNAGVNANGTGGNDVLFGHSNTGYLSFLGHHYSQGWPCLGFHCYTSADSNNAQKYASGTLKPGKLAYNSGNSNLEYYTADAGTVDTEIPWNLQFYVTNAGKCFAKGFDAQSNTITNVANPSNAQDAATMSYVDTSLAAKAPLASPSFTGTISSVGNLSGSATNNAPPELAGFFTDLTGYGGLGTPLLIPCAFDRMLYLTDQGGTITSSVAPAGGTLASLVDGSGSYAYFPAASVPINVTFTLPSAWSTMRQFIMYFYPGYAPKEFSVAFYDASDNLLGSDAQTNWSASKQCYCFPTSGTYYGTKKVVVTLTAPKDGYAYIHLFEVCWTYYSLDPFPAYLKRNGGTLYGTVNAPTPAVDTNTTQIATTQFVVNQGYLKSATAGSTYVPQTRQVNGHPLSGDVSVTKGDVGLGNVANVDTTTTANISDSSNKRFCTDAEKTIIGNTSGTNSGNETTTSIGSLINGATDKTTPVDADQVGLMDSAASNVLKKLSWSNIKATLKTYFDTLYDAAGAASTVQTNLTTHTGNTSNPHSVTKSQVGLGNVANVDTTTTANITDSTNKRYVTDAQLTVLGNISGTNTGDETTTRIGSLINGATDKTTPVDADQVGLMDSAASNVLKKLSWANLKAALKTYFDTIYTLANLGGVPTSRTINNLSLTGNITLIPGDLGLGIADQVAFGSLGLGRAAGTGGIAFPSTQAAVSDANTLDDYEEGSWTPVLTINGSTTGISYATDGQVGRYVKIGRLVYVQAWINLTSKGSSSGTATITGLPFSSDNVTNEVNAGAMVVYSVASSSYINGAAYVFSGSSTIYPVYQTGTGWAYHTNASLTNSTQLSMTVCYQAGA